MPKVLKNTLIYTIGNILPQVVGFILLPIYTRYLTPAEYGIISSMMVLEGFLAIFSTLCLEGSITRLYWDYKTEESKRDFFGTIVLSITIAASVVFIAVFIFKNYFEQVFKSIEFYPFYFYVMIASFFLAFQHVPKTYLMLKQKAGSFVILSVLQFFLKSGFIILFIIIKKQGAAGYLKGNIFGVVLLFPVFLYISLKISNLRFKIPILKNCLKFSLPIIPPIITTWIVNMSSRIFIERYFSLQDVGLYSLSLRIAGLVSIFTVGLNLAYEPVFFKLANSNDQKNGLSEIDKYNHIFIFLVIVISFCISLFAREVITIFFDKNYKDAYLYISLISFSYLFGQGTGILSKYIRQSKKMKENMMISFSTAGVNIVSNVLFISHYGAYGAAYSLIITLAYSFFVTYLYTKKKCFFIPLKWRKIIPVVACLGSIVILFQYIFTLNVLTALIFKTAAVGLLSMFFIRKYYSQIKGLVLSLGN